MRNLSKGTQAVRAAGGVSRKEFEVIKKTEHFQRLAGMYAAKNGITHRGAKTATSKFTRLYLKAYYKDGRPRQEKELSKAANGAIAKLRRATDLYEERELQWRHYVIPG